MSLTLAEDSPLAPLLQHERLMDLGPGKPDLAVREAMNRLETASACAPASIGDAAMAQCCIAAIWLYHDFLEQSHRISQGITTSSGSYWHAIMHRREPDSWNSKYWFERVGRHPIFTDLCHAARKLMVGEPALPPTDFLRKQSQWDPCAFVDLCEAARLGRVPAETLCRRIQLVEWELLFDYCHRSATASTLR